MTRKAVRVYEEKLADWQKEKDIYTEKLCDYNVLNRVVLALLKTGRSNLMAAASLAKMGLNSTRARCLLYQVMGIFKSKWNTTSGIVFY